MFWTIVTMVNNVIAAGSTRLVLSALIKSCVSLCYFGLQVVHQERVTLESQVELLRPLAST